ncbi:MAG: 3-dehydroquinate synthase [Bauldia sp.]
MAEAIAQTATGNTSVVHVELGSRSYDILIGPGLLATAGPEVARLMPKARALVVTDSNVARHHLAPLTDSLRSAGVQAETFVAEAGEASKRFAVLEAVVDAILEAKLERNDVVIALGGGVIGDLTGFAAGIARRGMAFIQVPTSLLAQVDSSVGGKTGINTRRGKNLVGVFHQPKLVLADTEVLDTLSERHFRAGYAEVAKYGLINDAPFFHWLERSWRDVFAGGTARQHAITVSCQAKATIVARDETETGDRALLNLGHTFGHALEAATGYSDRLVHGEAISIGMALAADYSARTGLCSPDVPAAVRDHFAAVGLPVDLAEIPGEPMQADALMELIAQDKKVARGQLTFILMRGIGQAFIARDVPTDDIRAFLVEKLAP